MKRYVKRFVVGLCFSFAMQACGAIQIPAPSPYPAPPQAAWRAVGAVTVDAAGKPVSGVHCQLQDVPGWQPAPLTDANGYTAWLTITGGLRDTQVECIRNGYVPFSEHRRLATSENENLDTLVLTSEHVDPSGIPLEELAAIRGAMWPLGTASTCGALPLGPRPWQDDNVIATDFITEYTIEQQGCIINELKSRGYTHVVMGPLVDSDGYHGVWTPNDWRGGNFQRFLDAEQMFWDAGLKVVTFIHPDGWSLDQTKSELTPLLQDPRAQKLLRIVVPFGWEPCKYECSSYTWAAFGQWARETLPNSLVLLHTVADVDAPVGTDSLGDDNGHPNAEGWARVAPFYHGWLTQSTAFDNPTGTGGDRAHPELTNFQNWQRLFDARVSGSYQDRFQHGYAGWPTVSAWSNGRPLRVYAGEYKAYWTFWQHRTEAEGVTWGDASMASGADGYLDSGTVAVPVR